jgi:hypothetical protein
MLYWLACIALAGLIYRMFPGLVVLLGQVFLIACAAIFLAVCFQSTANKAVVRHECYDLYGLCK